MNYCPQRYTPKKEGSRCSCPDGYTEQDKDQGNDLADYLIKLDWRKFREQVITKTAHEQNPVLLLSNAKGEKIEAQNKTYFSQPSNKPNHIFAYINDIGELLLQNPMDSNRFSVYPSIDSYNQRTDYPVSKLKHDIITDELIPVEIHRSELIVLQK